MSSQDKNLPYEILTLSHLGFKYCSVLCVCVLYLIKPRMKEKLHRQKLFLWTLSLVSCRFLLLNSLICLQKSWGGHGPLTPLLPVPLCLKWMLHPDHILVCQNVFRVVARSKNRHSDPVFWHFSFFPQYINVRTLSFRHLLSAMLNWFNLLCQSESTVDLISAKTSKEGIKCARGLE